MFCSAKGTNALSVASETLLGVSGMVGSCETVFREIRTNKAENWPKKALEGFNHWQNCARNTPLNVQCQASNTRFWGSAVSDANEKTTPPNKMTRLKSPATPLHRTKNKVEEGHHVACYPQASPRTTRTENAERAELRPSQKV